MSSPSGNSRSKSPIDRSKLGDVERKKGITRQKTDENITANPINAEIDLQSKIRSNQQPSQGNIMNTKDASYKVSSNKGYKSGYSNQDEQPINQPSSLRDQNSKQLGVTKNDGYSRVQEKINALRQQESETSEYTQEQAGKLYSQKTLSRGNTDYQRSMSREK